MEKSGYTTIDEYIALFPQTVQQVMNRLRKTIAETVPGAEETISYRMPAFRLNKKVLVYFGGFKDHIGFFPTSSGVAAFQKELEGYRTSKGTIQFPFDKELPLDLVIKIVTFRMNKVTNKKV